MSTGGAQMPGAMRLVIMMFVLAAGLGCAHTRPAERYACVGTSDTPTCGPEANARNVCQSRANADASVYFATAARAFEACMAEHGWTPVEDEG
jgi:hypothetical protein